MIGKHYSSVDHFTEDEAKSKDDENEKLNVEEEAFTVRWQRIALNCSVYSDYLDYIYILLLINWKCILIRCYH